MDRETIKEIIDLATAYAGDMNQYVMAYQEKIDELQLEAEEAGQQLADSVKARTEQFLTDIKALGDPEINPQ
jgi:hypothetical protein